MFQVFLNELSTRNPKQLKVLILDNGAFHKAKKLIIPDNIVLVFQPAYSPEVNAAEKIWAAYKRAFSNLLCKTLDQVSDFIEWFSNNLSSENVIKTTRFEFVKQCVSWTIL